MGRLERLGNVLDEAAVFVEELSGEHFDPTPQLKEYSLNPQTTRDFGELGISMPTQPGIWITHVPSHAIYAPKEFPPDFPGQQDDFAWHSDIYNLALETGQHLFIQKSEARREVEKEVYEEQLDAMNRRVGELTDGVIRYYTTNETLRPDYLLQLATDYWAARSLSEGFGHLTAHAFAGRKIPDSPFMKSIRMVFPVPKKLVDEMPLPDKYGLMQERLGTLYITNLARLYSGLGVSPKELFRRLIRVKRGELPEIGARMKQLYTSLP